MAGTLTSAPPASVPLPPGGPIEIVFSFDTTGSMSSCLPKVRNQIAYVIDRLTADIPGLRIAVFAHGDYCDKTTYGYVTKHLDFTDDAEQLTTFVNEVSGTGGGDFEECYELVLRLVRTQLSWTPGTQRALVMIGDATPHEPDYSLNKENINWRVETNELAYENVRIYAVQCLNNTKSDSFYAHLAKTTGGKHLKLDQLHSMVEIMMGICYREKGAEFLEDYEKEIRQRDGSAIQPDLERMFDTLKDKKGGKPTKVVKPTFATPSTSASSLFDSDSSDESDSTSAGSSGSTDSKRRRKITKILTRAKGHKMVRRTKDLVAGTPSKRRRSVTQKCAEKVLRERTAHRDFILGNLRWSHWREAMANTAPTTTNQQWVDRLNHTGYKRSHLFKEMADPAVYEIAVRTPDCKQKVPVMASVTIGLEHRSWEAGLLSSPHVKEQVDNVLRRGCKLYVRKAAFGKKDLPGVYGKIGPLKRKGQSLSKVTEKEAVNELRGLVTRNCDYAWRQHYDSEKKCYSHRPLTKKGTIISE